MAHNATATHISWLPKSHCRLTLKMTMAALLLRCPSLSLEWLQGKHLYSCHKLPQAIRNVLEVRMWPVGCYLTIVVIETQRVFFSFQKCLWLHKFFSTWAEMQFLKWANKRSFNVAFGQLYAFMPLCLHKNIYLNALYTVKYEWTKELKNIDMLTHISKLSSNNVTLKLSTCHLNMAHRSHTVVTQRNVITKISSVKAQTSVIPYHFSNTWL